MVSFKNLFLWPEDREQRKAKAKARFEALVAKASDRELESVVAHAGRIGMSRMWVNAALRELQKRHVIMDDSLEWRRLPLSPRDGE